MAKLTISPPFFGEICDHSADGSARFAAKWCWNVRRQDCQSRSAESLVPSTELNTEYGGGGREMLLLMPQQLKFHFALTPNPTLDTFAASVLQQPTAEYS
ncbi:MAG: hypothetical protein GC179_26870 [Anaerolineaceae bacterium]|nr:hypothetical protein [Anaerolineaceae bacterium]